MSRTPPHPRGILDTSAVLRLQHVKNPSHLPEEPLVTVITLAELSVGPLVARLDEERAARQIHLQQVKASFEPIPFDSRAARAFGLVAASLRRSERKTTARSFDAIIAAIALAHGLPVYTRNPRDFEGIEGLEVVAV